MGACASGNSSSSKRRLPRPVHKTNSIHRQKSKFQLHVTISDELDFNPEESIKMPISEVTDNQIVAEISRRKLGLNDVTEIIDRLDTSQFSKTLAFMKPLGMASHDDLAYQIKTRDIIMRPMVSEATVHEFYDIEDLIGEGASAKVYRCKHRVSGESFACKVIQRDSNLNDAESMSTELEIMKRVRHEHVVSMYEVFVSPPCIWLILELVEGGSLRNLLRSIHHCSSQHRISQSISERDIARLIRQILIGVQYLHSIGVVHRDLKLDNILVQKEPIRPKHENHCDNEAASDMRIPPELRLKIADFGLSALVRIGEQGYRPSSIAKRKGFNLLSEHWGTSEYQAPELIAGAYGPQADMWAVGCIMYEMISGSKAFPRRRGERTYDKQKERVRQREIDFNRPNLASVSRDTRDFMLKLLTVSATKRLSAEEALNHPWILRHT